MCGVNDTAPSRELCLKRGPLKIAGICVMSHSVLTLVTYACWRRSYAVKR